MSPLLRTSASFVALGLAALIGGCDRKSAPTEEPVNPVGRAAAEAAEPQVAPVEKKPEPTETTAPLASPRPSAPGTHAPAPKPAPASAAPEKKLTLADVAPVQAERALREAVRLAAKQALEQLGSKGGFAADSNTRIGMPAAWTGMETAIRKVGRDQSVDAFLTSLNAAAEAAARKLAPELDRLAAETSLSDPKQALTSSADGGTRALFMPSKERVRAAAAKAVAAALESGGVNAARDAMVADAHFANPFTNIKSVDGFDLAGHVAERLVSHALATIADREKAIRDDPSLLESETSAAVLEAAR